ncbi:GntR family transcriptional regulator [Demetria terragena]|uniref:GntR family transcriptional regulator n=1 Tax=Demetria terragena TaxID=63959 RepID=UPI00036DABB2|nr:GntR family transcriptional regulator [Demetria terragena]
MEPIGTARSLRDQALDTLRQAIVTGEIRPGELHSAASIAKRLGVSVSPVREAMLTLVNEGILEAIRNRGFRVVEITADDLADVIELRQWLEVPALMELATRPQELVQAMPRLRDLCGAIERLAKAGDAVEFLARDREFHLSLIALHGNRRLVESVAVLRDQTRLYGIPGLASAGALEEAAREQRRVLGALEAGEAEQVRELMQLHLSRITAGWTTEGVAPSLD